MHKSREVIRLKEAILPLRTIASASKLSLGAGKISQGRRTSRIILAFAGRSYPMMRYTRPVRFLQLAVFVQNNQQHRSNPAP